MAGYHYAVRNTYDKGAARDEKRWLKETAFEDIRGSVGYASALRETTGSLTGRCRGHPAAQFQAIAQGWAPSSASSDNFEATPIRRPSRTCRLNDVAWNLMVSAVRLLLQLWWWLYLGLYERKCKKKTTLLHAVECSGWQVVQLPC